MRFTEIDGKRYEVGACGECPFREMDGYDAHCTYPTVDQDPKNTLWIEDGVSIQEGCPLREVQEHKPCPFCGSTNVKEVYIDNERNELNEWAMDVANKQLESGGLMGFNSWDEFVHINAEYYYIKCDNCSAGVISRKGMDDAWAKWDRRAKE